MKIAVNKNILLGGIQTVQNIISAKITLPILSHILLETQNNNLKLTGTDLDIGISCVIPVDNIQEQGAITVPAKRFGEIIRELPEETISITTKKNNFVLIETKNCEFKIAGLSKEEYPTLPEFKDREIIKLEQPKLKQMLKMVSFAASYDETRYILNGVLFEIQNNQLTLVTTDSKRLAIIEKKLTQQVNKDIRVIIPIKTIYELNRNLKEEGELSLILGGNQILFDLKDVIIISRLIEGEFPDYRQVVSNAISNSNISENKIKVNREGFLLAVRRAALLATPDYQAVKLELFKDKMVISKSTPDIGESREELIVDYKGKEMMIGFNPNYLIDVLKNLESEEIVFELIGVDKPGLIRTDGYIYLVLPMLLE